MTRKLANLAFLRQDGPFVHSVDLNFTPLSRANPSKSTLRVRIVLPGSFLFTTTQMYYFTESIYSSLSVFVLEIFSAFLCMLDHNAYKSLLYSILFKHRHDRTAFKFLFACWVFFRISYEFVRVHCEFHRVFFLNRFKWRWDKNNLIRCGFDSKLACIPPSNFLFNWILKTIAAYFRNRVGRNRFYASSWSSSFVLYFTIFNASLEKVWAHTNQCKLEQALSALASIHKYR